MTGVFLTIQYQCCLDLLLPKPRAQNDRITYTVAMHNGMEEGNRQFDCYCIS